MNIQVSSGNHNYEIPINKHIQEIKESGIQETKYFFEGHHYKSVFKVGNHKLKTIVLSWKYFIEAILHTLMVDVSFVIAQPKVTHQDINHPPSNLTGLFK